MFFSLYKAIFWCYSSSELAGILAAAFGSCASTDDWVGKHRVRTAACLLATVGGPGGIPPRSLVPYLSDRYRRECRRGRACPTLLSRHRKRYGKPYPDDSRSVPRAEREASKLFKLKKLELLGFKSFADRSRLEFSDGVAAVVGPNGCGKSNLSDAITWVLGEQSARMLRGERMADVIFNGTGTRPPTGMAEVSMTLVNPEYNESRACRKSHGERFSRPWSIAGLETAAAEPRNRRQRQRRMATATETAPNHQALRACTIAPAKSP